MAEFKIGRLRFTWEGTWATSKTYNRDAVVLHEGKTYVCLVPHTSGDFYSDLAHVTQSGAFTPYWDLTLPGHTWKGEWAPTTIYSLDNIVTYGGALYKCNAPHTSASVLDITKFDIYATFDKWNSAWQISTAYGVGDLVKYGGVIYQCTVNHVSAATVTDGLELDSDKWIIAVSNIEFKGTWNGANIRYKFNDLVKLSSNLYICTAGHTTNGTFDTDKWDLWLPGEEYKGSWLITATYQLGDTVDYGGYSYISLSENNIGNVPSTDAVDWILLHQDFSMTGDWTNGSTYKVGDVVRKNGYVYVAIADTTSDPGAGGVSTTYVPLGSSGTTLKVANTAGIVPGMLVIGTGFATAQEVSQVTNGTTVILSHAPDSTPDTLITFEGVNAAFWQIVTPGVKWRNFWISNTNYNIGDLVIYVNATYRCVQQHSSTSVTRPDLDTVNTYWSIYAKHAPNNALKNQGDLLTFSQQARTPLPIGSNDQTLIAQLNTNGEITPAWKSILITPNVYYVCTTSGTDDATHGLTWDRPWKTIKYACDTLLTGTQNPTARLALVTNKAWAVEEMYQWMLYSKAQSINGFTPSSTFDSAKTRRDAELIIDALANDISRGGNSQTVAAAQAYFTQDTSNAFITDGTEAAMPYIIAALQFLSTLINNYVMASTSPSTSYQVLNNVPSNQVISFTGTGFAELGTGAYVASLLKIITDALINESATSLPPANAGVSATIMVKTGTYSEELPIVVPEQVAVVGDELRGAVVQPAVVVDTFTTMSQSVTNIFKVLTTANMYPNCPIQFVSSSNFIPTLSGFEDAIVAGQTYYIVPGSINSDDNTIQITDAIDGAPLELNGGQGSMQVIGAMALSDMFRMRNASGLRNMTVTGLLGTLTATNQYGTKRPTGGSFVALDPGAGPDDTSAWIIRRSPYIQNVTTFGVGCVGMKVDGTLHNGGNKSIVANDFTQIISDGVGAWVTGPDSKSELISVFTYYCYTSYFAENGGRIRAANGNSSYGELGVVAEGYDSTESPITGNINNQNGQAICSVQQSYGTNQNILKLQYSNAGVSYYTPTTNLVSYSNLFTNGAWTTDGNITLLQNVISPSTYSDGWTVTGTSSFTDSSYIYQNISVTPTGAVYTGLAGSNISGSGSNATFDVTVNATGYTVVVASGGTGGSGYVYGNQITIYGSQVGGIDGTNDITLTVASLSGSTILTVTNTGTVPAGSALNYTLSVYAKKGSSSLVDLYGIYSGTSTRTSAITFNLDTLAITPSNGGDGGLTPTAYGYQAYTNGWYRIWVSIYDTNALNSTLQFRIYPRGKTGSTGYTYLYGAQAEIGSTPNFYLSTTTGRYSAYADYVINGAGTGAILVADETRSSAIYQTRITDPGSGAGGSGYLTASNNAQGGDTQSVTLSQSDINTSANYNGMRVFINSGTGAGQYGFISSYNASSKIAYVLKESITPLIVTNTASSTNLLSLDQTSDVSTLYINQPVQFIPTYYNTTVTATSLSFKSIATVIGGQTNTISVESTSGLYYNMAVTFTGTIYGGVVSNYTYYISNVIDATTFQIASTPYGNAMMLTSSQASTGMIMNIPSNSSYMTGYAGNMTPNMPIQFTGSGLGGVTPGTIYYVNDVVDSNTFTISSGLVSITATVSDSTGFTTTSTSALVPLNPIVFAEPVFGAVTANQKYYISSVVNSTKFTISQSLISVAVAGTEALTNLVTVSSTTGFAPGNPIRFTGLSFGGITAETTYYILAVNDATTFTISASVNGAAVSLTTATGLLTAKTCPNTFVPDTGSGSMIGKSSTAKVSLSTSTGSMNAIFSTPVFGGVSAGTTYYISSINTGLTNTFTISGSPGGLNVALTTAGGTMQAGEVGWDHVNPGTPSVVALDSTSLYYIEPKLSYSEPNFSYLNATSTVTMASAYTAIAFGNRLWMAVSGGNQTIATSTDGSNWTPVTLPVGSAPWSGVAYGNNAWVIISSTGLKSAYSFSNGQSWKSSTLPSTTGSWNSITYGNGAFVAVSTGSNKAAYSTSYGASWSSATLPSSTTWSSVAYGGGIFVTVASGGTAAAYSTNNGATWTSSTLPSSTTWSRVRYGNGRFVAVSSTSGKPAYSFDGITWYQANYSIAADVLSYGNGVFLALKANSSTAWTSEDGLSWKQRTVISGPYTAAAYGITASSAANANAGVFVTVGGTSTVQNIFAGAKPKGRPNVTSGIITSITEWETGGNNPVTPTVTIFDPNVTSVASATPRVGNGVLSAPTFINRGVGYVTSSTSIAVNGSGYADSYQTGLAITVKNLTQLPRPGDDLTISGNDIIYKVTSASILNGTSAPNLTSSIQISPAMSVALSPDHNTSIIIREKYSQVRITNHDFLNIGYGDKIQSNYPGFPTETELQPQNQQIENNYGRVFYTSTDQDGNFKVGNLFGVEQATGIVTLSASQFGLSGLSQLTLGGIAVGGSSTVITQFSTDQTFVANSDRIIPTQRAVKAYLAGRLSQGGSNTFTGQTTAGTVVIGGPNVINNTIPQGTAGSSVRMLNKVMFNGVSGGQLDGAIVAFDMFMTTGARRGNA